uniref:Uncharacterized protein n=1 Tax=Cannabis sativa TaxID=3483 RepID=A0A803QSK7_CANSA
MKKWLEKAKRNWPEELPEVLWSYRTMEKTTTGRTPFVMAYGYEAMFPMELKPSSHRRLTYNKETNHALRAGSLGEIEEERTSTNLKLVDHQQKVARYLKKQVRTRKFLVGDMVLRREFLNIKDNSTGMLKHLLLSRWPSERILLKGLDNMTGTQVK